MATVSIFPYEVVSDKSDEGGKIVFKFTNLTVKEMKPVLEGVSKASGKDYHIPPRVIFEEDPNKEEWQWQVYDESFSPPYRDLPESEFPSPGDVLNFQLAATPKRNGEGHYLSVSKYDKASAVIKPKSDIADLDKPKVAAPSTNSGYDQSRPAKGMSFNNLGSMLTSGKIKEQYGEEVEKEAMKTWLYGFVASASGGVPFENFNDTEGFNTWSLVELFQRLRGEIPQAEDGWEEQGQ